MDRPAYRLTITLGPEHAARLARLALLAGVPEDTLARTLLAEAIQEADPGPPGITAILDGIPGACERAIQSRDRGLAGESIALEDL